MVASVLVDPKLDICMAGHVVQSRNRFAFGIPVATASSLPMAHNPCL